MIETTQTSRPPRASFGPEVLAWLLFAICLGAMEGGVVSVLVRTFYRQSVDALTLDYTVAVLVGAPLFANLASLGWASVGQGRALHGELVPLQLLCVFCLLLVAAAPRNAAGLAMIVAGAVSARLLWSGVLMLRTTAWRTASRTRRARDPGGPGRGRPLSRGRYDRRLRRRAGRPQARRAARALPRRRRPRTGRRVPLPLAQPWRRRARRRRAHRRRAGPPQREP